MKVILSQFPGHILICDQCGALLQYTMADVYGNNLVYCPICKYGNEIEYDRNYDGTEIKNVDSNTNSD
jgi:DNA-directed RNA polymerase subunit M/transcription elongation factor TFIIS